VELGDLTIVGIRNGATAVFEGGFTQDVTLHYGEGLTGELNVELAIGDIYSDINLLHNAAVLNIDSQGIENHMHSFFAGGSISRMNVTGTGAFGAEEDLNTSFNSDRPAIIDASANTGGLDVTLNGHYNVEIQGTMANDELTAESSGEVLINAYDGKMSSLSMTVTGSILPAARVLTESPPKTARLLRLPPAMAKMKSTQTAARRWTSSRAPARIPSPPWAPKPLWLTPVRAMTTSPPALWRSTLPPAPVMTMSWWPASAGKVKL